MKIFGWIGLLLIALPLMLMLAGQLGFLAGQAPANLGVRDGRLKPPSKTPNSVSSQAKLYPDHPQRSYADIAPLAYQGDGQAAIKKLATLLRAAPRTVVVTESADYLYAQSTTPLLKFTDDLEFWLSPTEGVIHMRSASRLGRKDFETNRRRLEDLRVRFQAP